MSAHVEWSQAESCPVSHAGPGDAMPDGQQIDQDKWALMLGSDCGPYLVVEGSSAELLAFAARVSEAAMAGQRGGYVAAPQPVVEVSQAEYDAGEAAFTRSGQDMGSERITEVEDVIRAVRPVVVAAAYAELADELTELAESMRTGTNREWATPTRAAGLAEGITVIRERVAALQAQAEQGTSPS